MASKISDNIVAGDLLLIKELAPYIGMKKDLPVLLKLAKNGAIATETLLEMAISKVGKLERSAKDGQDFVDGSDAKKAIPYFADKAKKVRVAWIGKIFKNGYLRIAVSDPLAKEVYYFKVPKSHLEHLKRKKRDCFTITFSTNGGPPDNMNYGENRNNGWGSLSYRMWNFYRVSSFKELCS
jgi:hypothetical protein